MVFSERQSNPGTDLEDPGEGNEEKSVSKFRTVLPQILASSAKNLILVDLGMTLAFPTIVIPALLNGKDGLQFTPEQASWFGSIAFICQPAGSFVSGLMFEPLGRKRAMMLVNVPHFIAWLILCWANTLEELYIAAVILGLGVGFMEAPIITYVGEIAQPKIRGILTSYAGLFVTIGFSLVFFLGSLTDWQTAAAICAGAPAFAVIVISQIPESPIWLLNQGRLEDAEKSLCWLRGWVKPEQVKVELHELMQHNYKQKNLVLPTINASAESFRNISDGCIEKSENEELKKKGSLSKFQKVKSALRLTDLLRSQTMQPLIVVTLMFLFHHLAGVSSMRPFLVGLFKELGTPLDAHLTTTISSVVTLVGNIGCMILVPYTGKKLLSFISLGSCAVINLVLCAYLSLATSETKPVWIPVVLYFALLFAFSIGIIQVPWMLLSEVFPFRGRGVASGVAAALSYVIGFLTTKTYINLHDGLTLPGLFGFHGLCSIVGCMYLYFVLPETEGKTLAEIEQIFYEKFQKLRKKKWRRDNTA